MIERHLAEKQPFKVLLVSLTLTLHSRQQNDQGERQQGAPGVQVAPVVWSVCEVASRKSGGEWMFVGVGVFVWVGGGGEGGGGGGGGGLTVSRRPTPR